MLRRCTKSDRQIDRTDCSLTAVHSRNPIETPTSFTTHLRLDTSRWSSQQSSSQAELHRSQPAAARSSRCSAEEILAAASRHCQPSTSTPGCHRTAFRAAVCTDDTEPKNPQADRRLRTPPHHHHWHCSTQDDALHRLRPQVGPTLPIGLLKHTRRVSTSAGLKSVWSRWIYRNPLILQLHQPSRGLQHGRYATFS